MNTTLPPKGEPVTKKAKTVSSVGKVMVAVFWDSHGIVFIDYLQEGKTIIGEYYASLLDEVKAEIAPHLEKKKMLFHQDIAPSHSQDRSTLRFD